MLTRKDVLLVNAPVSTRSPHSRLGPPLGLAYVAATLLDAGITTDALDLNVSGLNPDRVARIIDGSRPRVVGISALTETFPSALRVARVVKESDPSITVVLGGAHATLRPREALADPAVDLVVIGEGERPMLEIAAHVLAREGRLEDVAGIAYRDGAGDGRVRVNERAPSADPDQHPYPARWLFPLELYRTPWTILTARGACPFRCPFCSSPTLSKGAGKRRPRSVESVVAEIAILQKRYGARHVTFVDDLFTVDGRWVHALAARLRELGSPIRWTCATRVDLVDPPLVSAMGAAGCAGIQFGVESGAQDLLDSVKQRVRKEEVVAAVIASREAGIEPLCSFMIPFPEDTEATIRETQAFIRELRALGAEISLSYTTPFPGTRFFDEAEDLGIRLLTRDWSEFDAKHNIIETRHLDAGTIGRLVRDMVGTMEVAPTD